MIKLRAADERGHFDHGWLDTRHTFSFADYHDPRFMGFRQLRVINEDRVQPGEGFGTHSHSDMEIVTYVLAGELAHRDSLGNGSIIRPGEVQRMSAGTGVSHSEYNASSSEIAHFLQIWILPLRRGLEASYEQKAFPPGDRLKLVGAPDGRDGAVTIHQDVMLYVANLPEGEIDRPIAPGRHGWVQVVRGTAAVNGQPVKAGDGVALSDEAELQLRDGKNFEALVFDLA